MATTPNSNINIPYSQFLDATTGRPSLEWLMWLMNPNFITINLGSALPVASGGTGLTTIPTSGQLLIGNGTGYTLNTLGYGAGISVTNGSGTITVANTGVLSNIAGSGISVSSATGNVTVSNTGVLSWSGGSTGLTPATATTGAVTLGGTLAIANGGTNGSAVPTAYGVAYGTGTTYAFTAAGTTGQVLTATTSGSPTWAAPATSGTVTSVGLSMPTQFTVTNSPVTSSGTLTASWNTQTANYVLAGPTTGAAAVPTFRALVAGDIPSLSYVTSVTGTSPVVSSGGTTPAISLAAAYGDTLNPYGTKTATYVLAGPATGAATAPTFRALVSTDIPSLSYVTSVGATAPITSTGGLTPTIGVTSAALSKTDDTNVTVTLGGSPTTALLAATSLTFGWAGQLSVGRGGTGLSAGTSGGIPYFSSTSAMASSALLTQYGIVYGGGAGASPVATAAGTTGQILTATTGGAPTWSSTYAGTVTSVSFTGGLITVATATTMPALTVAGTSGGIVYFSSGTTWASSAALAANAIVLGGGAGSAPATTTTGTGVVTALGVNTGTAGAFVVNGGVLGTPSSGTVTNLTGTASININGTVGATTANTGAFTTVSASGVITSTVATGTAPFTVASTTQVANLNAATAGTAGNVTGTVAVANGGTGLTSGTSGGVLYYSATGTLASSALLTQYGVVYGGGAGAAPVSTAAGTTGQVLTAVTSGAPIWANPATSGTVTSVSVVSANGFAGTVATATSTPAITISTSITGVLKGNGTAISAATANTDYQGVSAPVTKTADFTVAATDIWLINNKTGSACTVTLPAASSWTGRVLNFQTYQAQTTISASSNVVPVGGGSAGTSILLASVGDATTLVSDGTNWIAMSYTPNNILLL